MTVRLALRGMPSPMVEALPAGTFACGGCGRAGTTEQSVERGWLHRNVQPHPKAAASYEPEVSAAFGLCGTCAQRDAAWVKAFGVGWGRVGVAVRLLKHEGAPSNELLQAVFGTWDADLPNHPALRHLGFADWCGEPESMAAPDPWQTLDRAGMIRLRVASCASAPFSHVDQSHLRALHAFAQRGRDLLAHRGEEVVLTAAGALKAYAETNLMVRRVPLDRRVSSGCAACGRSAYAAPWGSDPTLSWWPISQPMSDLGVPGGEPFAGVLCSSCAVLDEDTTEATPLCDGLMEQLLAERLDGGWLAPGRLVRQSHAARVLSARRRGQVEPEGNPEPWVWLPATIEGEQQPGVLSRDVHAERAQQAAADAAQAERLGLTTALARAERAERIAVAATNVLGNAAALRAYQERQAAK